MVSALEDEANQKRAKQRAKKSRESFINAKRENKMSAVVGCIGCGVSWDPKAVVFTLSSLSLFVSVFW